MIHAVVLYEQSIIFMTIFFSMIFFIYIGLYRGLKNNRENIGISKFKGNYRIL
jgi:H2-forming N5,N10-methylenetetrahydromethanopterin dehydrogenase-like enzyme